MLLVIAAAVLSAATTPVFSNAARRMGLVVAPRADRWHRSATPLLGGAAITLAAIILVATLLPVTRVGATVTVGLVAAFGLGLLDGLRSVAPLTALAGLAGFALVV